MEVGALASNAYLVSDDGSPAGVVIDPGDEGDRIVGRCRKEGIQPAFIVDTHCHADHVGANAELKRAFPDAALCISAKDADGLARPTHNLAFLLGTALKGPAPDRLLAEGDVLQFGESALVVRETPGHTPGGICLLAESEGPPQMFCGDLIFRGGVGRVDFPGGDPDDLLASIRDKVFDLPDDTVLWCGHGPPSTVGFERRNNPYVGSRADTSTWMTE